MPRTSLGNFWRYLRPMVPPVILCALVVLTLREPISWWLAGEEKYDQEVIREWIREARIDQTLPELVGEYLQQVSACRRQAAARDTSLRDRVIAGEQRLELKREELYQHLQALGNPPTKIYRGQLPLFPVIYRLSIRFDSSLDLPPIIWDSELPRQKSQYRLLEGIPLQEQFASLDIKYHLHAYSQKQSNERQEARRRLWLSGLGLFFAVLGFVWIYVAQRRERERQRQRAQAEQQMSAAERLRLQEELRRQEAERRQEEAERQNLELKSQLFANIGIMAGSYAHNIKNLLLRPNDLLRRCLEENSLPDEQAHMLGEVRQTLGTVTERLQQILQTVRRDPSRSESVRIDLNALVREMQRTWVDLAREKWKLALEVDLWTSEPGAGPAPLWIEGDLSHLQQALENLLFNARDATFEMRTYLREQARHREPVANAVETIADAERRQALIAAASWRGQVLLRTRCEEGRAVLEVKDNGIGMTEEVRRRCTETHFSTKRNNALFAGLSAGMGLGLSFVTVILEHHRAKLEIESTSLEGALFRVRFPVLADVPVQRGVQGIPP
jgi:signal transduction histidine kinase